MCDSDSMDDMIEYQLKSTQLSRRRFGALTLGTGMMSLLPKAAGAAWVEESDVDIKTADGTCDAYFVHPAEGAHPGVLMWPDIFGLRPAFRHMGRRLAEAGYAVLVPNPFYRTRHAPTAPENPDFNDKPTRDALMTLMGSLSADTSVTDAKAFVGWLDSQPAVDRKRRMGTMGYCMSGPFTLRGAAALPDRIGAGASFHGGGLVTDKPDSPHLLVPKIKAHFLIAIASNDDERQPEQKTALREAFAKANVPAEIEVYEGALHGWCPPDSRVYNDAQAENAWSRMLELFRTTLGGPAKKA
ncbi:MAG TPA: dienelactone hydrolase family protein [Candidatus Dormibacteraeota bacterium]|nr:dienelactone hydrolase family protein [Candidatus Dormibacteraeota bacterium]